MGRRRMSRSLIAPAQKSGLIERVNAEREKAGEARGLDLDLPEGRFRVKLRSREHPNLKAHVKALRLIWSELNRIWEARPPEEQLYHIRFFNLAAVEPDFAVYEHTNARTVSQVMGGSFPPDGKLRRAPENRVTMAYDQLKADFDRAFGEFNRKHRGQVRVKGKSFGIVSDFTLENVLYEGPGEDGKPKFILADVISEQIG